MEKIKKAKKSRKMLLKTTILTIAYSISNVVVAYADEPKGPGAIESIKNFGGEVVTWIQYLSIPAAAIAFAIGGFQHIFGGPEGVRKAKPWYIGAAVGLVVCLGATAIVTAIDDKIAF